MGNSVARPRREYDHRWHLRLSDPARLKKEVQALALAELCKRLGFSEGQGRREAAKLKRMFGHREDTRSMEDREAERILNRMLEVEREAGRWLMDHSGTARGRFHIALDRLHSRRSFDLVALTKSLRSGVNRAQLAREFGDDKSLTARDLAVLSILADIPDYSGMVPTTASKALAHEAKAMRGARARPPSGAEADLVDIRDQLQGDIDTVLKRMVASGEIARPRKRERPDHVSD